LFGFVISCFASIITKNSFWPTPIFENKFFLKKFWKIEKSLRQNLDKGLYFHDPRRTERVIMLTSLE
jgi:hypothetical protein